MSNNIKILIVEDEQMLAEILSDKHTLKDDFILSGSKGIYLALPITLYGN